MSDFRRKGPGQGPGQGRGGERGGERGERGERRGRRGKPEPMDEGRGDNEFKEKVIQIRRVTKVVKGGKKLSFRAVVVVGNSNGQVGLGIGKSTEVIGAIQKGVQDAKKNLVTVPIHNETITHPINGKAGGGYVVLRPASKGTGVIAGGSVRAVIELSGIHNILTKSQGSTSPLNMARATIQALSELRSFETIARNRGMSVREMLVGTSASASKEA